MGSGWACCFSPHMWNGGEGLFHTTLAASSALTCVFIYLVFPVRLCPQSTLYWRQSFCNVRALTNRYLCAVASQSMAIFFAYCLFALDCQFAVYCQLAVYCQSAVYCQFILPGRASYCLFLPHSPHHMLNVIYGYGSGVVLFFP